MRGDAVELGDGVGDTLHAAQILCALPGSKESVLHSTTTQRLLFFCLAACGSRRPVRVYVRRSHKRGYIFKLKTIKTKHIETTDMAIKNNNDFTRVSLVK